MKYFAEICIDMRKTGEGVQKLADCLRKNPYKCKLECERGFSYSHFVFIPGTHGVEGHFNFVTINLAMFVCMNIYISGTITAKTIKFVVYMYCCCTKLKLIKQFCHANLGAR